MRRYASLTVGTTRITGLTTRFNVLVSGDDRPSTCEVQILGLSPANRSKLTSAKLVPVVLDVGYTTRHGVIFSGNLREVVVTRDGAECITTISGGDGERAIQTGRASGTVPAGAAVGVALSVLSEAMGLPVDDVTRTTFTVALRTRLPGGAVLDGSASDRLTEALRAAGLWWYVRQGRIVLTDRRISGSAIVLTPSSGLVGSPSAGRTDDGRATVQCRALLVADAVPGKAVVLKSSNVEGTYLVRRSTFRGATDSGEWYVDLDLEAPP